MEEIRFSPYGRSSVRPSPVNRMMAAFSEGFRPGVDVNLGVGYVSDAAIPRESIRSAFEHVLANDRTGGSVLNYGPPAGVPQLVDALRRWHQKCHGQPLGADQRVIIGPSGATSLLEAAAGILSTGIVITGDPVYYIYTDLLERLGYELLAIPEDAQGIDVKALERQLAAMGPRLEQISFFYLVTVSNPTCTILSNDRRKQIVELVTDLSKRLNRKVPVLLDTAYEPLVYGPSAPRPRSVLAHDPLGIVHELGSFSKVFAPALRVGYVIGRSGPFMDAMVQRGSDSALGPPPLNQHVAAHLLDHHIDEQTQRTAGVYGQKADQIRRWIDQHLGDRLADCRGGEAGFYFYLTFKDTLTDEQSPFFRFLTRTTGNPQVDRPTGEMGPRVIYVPGEFCVHRRGDLTDVAKRQLRISFGYEDLSQIESAIKLMGQAVEYARSTA